MAPVTRSKRSASSSKQPEGSSTKAKKPGAADRSSSTQPLTLEGFVTLPREVQTYIMSLATSSSVSSAQGAVADAITTTGPESQQAFASPRPFLDVATTLSLITASKAFYALVAPLLYGSICITRPSALAALHFALSSRPGLANLVKSLYVGPIGQLPEWYDPITVEDRADIDMDCAPPLRPLALIRSSLRPDRDAKHLLRWSAWEKQWLYNIGGYEPASKAVCDAVASAERIIDVDLDRNRRSKGGERLAPLEYLQRVFEVQAALDSYLTAIKFGEEDSHNADTHDSDEEASSTSPPLVVTGYPGSPRTANRARSGKKAFVVSRSQLLRHLARPYAVTDRFDHPLIFARSGLQVAALTMWDFEPSRRHQLEGSGAEDWAKFFSPSSSLLESTSPSLHSLLNLLRAILAQVNGLKNLSLAGFLNLAVCGGQTTTLSFNSLRSLSIGPVPQKWFHSLELQRFAGVESLRLAGIRLHEAELDAIVAMFPALRSMRWSMASLWRFEHTPSLSDCISRLAGLEAKSLDEEQGVVSAAEANSTLNLGQQVRGDGESMASPGGSDSDLSASLLPLIEVKMHPVDLRTMLEAQPDPAVRRAWTLGLPLPNQKRRLLLAESLPESMVSEWRPLVSEDLFEEALEWWEEYGGRGTEKAWAGAKEARDARGRSIVFARRFRSFCEVRFMSSCPAVLGSV